MSKVIPNDWSRAKLGDYIGVQGGNAFKSEYFSDNGVPIIRISNIKKDGSVNLKGAVYFEKDSNLAKFKAIKGDILIAMSGATTGKVGRYKSDVFSYINQRVGRFFLKKTNEGCIDFIHQITSEDEFTNSVLIDAVGGAQPNISNQQIESILVNFPPLSEQQKIAKILISVDDVIEKIQEQIDKLKDLKTGMMQELLTNGIGHTEFKDSPVGKIPAEWEVKTVESVLSKIIDYRGKAPPKSEIGVPLITAKNIRNGFINQEPREYIYEDQFDSWMVRGMPLSGDVFITTEAPLGNVAKVPNYKFAIGQRVLTLRPNEFVCTEFLLFILQSEKFKKELDLQSTGSTVAGIKQSTFRKVLLPVPAIDEQIKISESLNSIVRRSDVIKDKLQTFKSLKKALMQDLLTGKVRVKVS